MPPKKAAAPEAKPLIGRVGTNLKVGIVGLPNVGKSTFFNVLTKSQAQAENFPFCTIDPNESRVPVPDERFEYLRKFHKPASKVSAFLNVTDIAGLVKGASEGQGLGNAFLSHIKACDALFHLTRAFDDDDVTHIEGDVNPVRDLEIINEELRLKDIEYAKTAYDKIAKLVERGDKKLKAEYDVLVRVKDMLEVQKKHIRFADWDAKEIIELNQHLFITSKPMLYLVNLSEKDYIRKKNKWLLKIKEWVDANDPGALLIPFSGVFESKLLDMDEEQREAYIKENNCPRRARGVVLGGSARSEGAPYPNPPWRGSLPPLASGGLGTYIRRAGSASRILPPAFDEATPPLERSHPQSGRRFALDKIILQGYKALQLEYYFTCGPDEVKAWTIQKGTKAPQAAGKIHTDFEKGFVMAEVMKFDDFKEEGSEAAVKAAGKYHQRGRQYVVEDGDIIFFKFNTGGLKKK